MPHQTPRLPLLTLTLLLPLALACASGSGGGGGPVYSAEFPSQQDVQRIENAPPPQTVFDPQLRYVQEWKLEAPAPERIEQTAWVDGSAWGALLGDLAKTSRGSVVPTQAMHCVASELARFTLERGGNPDLLLRDFIVAGCNASAGDVSFRFLQGEAASSERDEEICERWREQTALLVRSEIGQSQRAIVGIGFARQGDRAAVVVASAHPLVEIEPVKTQLAPGERFELRGRVLGPVAFVEAAINRGRYRVAVCEPVGEVKLPAFAFACEADASDTWARVSLDITEPRRVLGKRALEALVWPNGGGDRVYRRAEYTSAQPIGESSLLTPAFVEALNRVRAQAGLRAVALDPAESATASRVAPHFFAALSGSANQNAADQAALGLVAGWDVDGTIRTGNFVFGLAPQTDDLAILLATTLEEPAARLVLLDPQADRLAVGPIAGRAGDVPVLAAVVTTYAIFDDGTKRADADALFSRLAEQRRKRGLEAPTRLVSAWMNAMSSADQVARGEPAKEVLDDLLQSSVNYLAPEVQGWSGATSDLDRFEFPEEMLTARSVRTAIGVSHRKEPGQAWGYYVVLIVASAH